MHVACTTPRNLKGIENSVLYSVKSFRPTFYIDAYYLCIFSVNLFGKVLLISSSQNFFSSYNTGVLTETVGGYSYSIFNYFLTSWLHCLCSVYPLGLRFAKEWDSSAHTVKSIHLSGIINDTRHALSFNGRFYFSAF